VANVLTCTQFQEKKWAKGDRSGVIRTQEAIGECALTPVKSSPLSS